MKFQLVIVLVIAGVFAMAQAQDISALLMDKNYVLRQIDCVLERGRCDSVGQQLKVALPEALNNNCRRCTPSQARNARKLVEFMKRNHPNEWLAIADYYANKYRA
ncbi:ejaculatory bulb-specific protein 3-like [Orussus abietinus]|uniref:ejaculatory bulb-specific protein 3-like n=1 Tax=Orussus abietinus TaxID=222816 RepID=UPI0006263D3C|nr:ejaculatory bulb-specific protein 3-like [Orussus abietinus]